MDPNTLIPVAANAAPEHASFDRETAEITRQSGVPSLAAAAVLDGRIIAAGASGIRKLGSPEKVTLRQLLTNTGGAPADVPSDLWAALWKAKGSPTSQRMKPVEGTVATAPSYEPGKGTAYATVSPMPAPCWRRRRMPRGRNCSLKDSSNHSA